MRRDVVGHHVKLGFKRIACVSHLTIPDMTGPTPYLAGKTTDTRSSKSNQASRTHDCSYPLVSSISFPSSSPITLSLPSSHNTKLSHPSLSLHVMIMSSYWVQHLPSTASTEYSIHRRYSVFPSFSRLWVDRWMQLQLPVCPSTRSITTSQLSMRSHM